MAGLSVRIRTAVRADIASLEPMIAASARMLGRGFYSEAETEAAIAHVFGVDSQLVEDGTYVVAVDPGDRVLGCGGWSRRRTLFGGDRFAGRDPGLLDPARDAAKIRAFFVAPAAARQGVGSLILDACEGAAAAAGFRTAELMATLPGIPFYAARGYVPGVAIQHPCGNILVRFQAMTKQLLQK